MYQVSVNQHQYEIIPENNTIGKGSINGIDYKIDISQTDATNWVVRKDGIDYRVEISDINSSEKEACLRINGRKYAITLTDQFDKILKELGIDRMGTKKISEIRSPMPGLVIDILVQPGDHLKKGDQILVLEAMKMENMIKSQADLIVQSIEIQLGAAVKKGQILLKFK